MKQITLIIYFLLNIIFYGQSVLEHKTDNIIVTANRTPTISKKIGRTMHLLGKKELKSLPASNLQDILEYTSGLDVKQRGVAGVQSDISIRGGSFEQTLILVNGIKLTDPQTGHHNMNLPLTYSQIERIEILKGQGARSFGANAFSGVINIITKSKSKTGLNIDLSGGEFDYTNFTLGGNISAGNTLHNISLNRTNSTGYRHNTDFTNYSISMNNSFNFSNTVLKTLFGYTDKDFGANSFYTNRFPNQAERTKTLLAAISGDIQLGAFNILSKLSWRKGKDNFVLKRNNPAFYENNHTTNSYGFELQASSNFLEIGTTSFGVELNKDDIVSSNLGEHNRTQLGLFFEQQIDITSKLNVNLGGFAYKYSNYGWKFIPTFDLAYLVNDNLKVYTNYGRAFRIPTYTDLYYQSYATRGNADLKPEETINYELGIGYQTNFLQINGALFRKEGSNLIDYALDETDSLWKAKNINKININGFELSLSVNTNKLTKNIITKIGLEYTYLDAKKIDANIKSKYVLEHLVHDLSFSIFNILPLGIKQSWVFSFEDRIKQNDIFKVDTKLYRDFDYFNVYVSITNIFNKVYEEFPGVELPGRWITGGVKININ
ncbi:MAG: hypothetical protein CR986_07570 [Ignavibacteriae bacterium]|nr:MAG: hypothetical protein CR986_07570 [Ignavibacteriota bacterium]